MLRSKQFHLKLIHGLEQWNQSEILSILSSEFSDEAGFGFVDSYFEEGVFVSNFVYKSISRKKIFDPSRNSFLFQDQESFFYFPFQIDLIDNLLIAECSGQKLSKLLAILGMQLRFQIEVENIIVDFEKLLIVLKDAISNYKIEKITIDDFQPIQGLLGRYSASIQNNAIAEKLIQETSSIRSLELVLFNFNSEARCRISNFGSFVIRTDEDDLEQNKNLLINSIIETYNNA